MSDALSYKVDAMEKAKTTSTRPWPIHPVIAVLFVAIVFIAAQALAVLLLGLVLTGFNVVSADKLGDFVADSTLMQFIYILIAESLVIGSLALLLRYKKLSFAMLGLTKPRWRDVGSAVAGYAVYFCLYALIVVVLSNLVTAFDTSQRQDVGFQNAVGPSLLWVAFALIVLAPVTEEILMRGFLFTSLRSRLNFKVATLITSLVFAAAHLLGGEEGAPPLWIAALDTFTLSLILCYLREKTGRLWAGIGVHALKNTVAFVLLFIASK
jgi:membrane protease YdiL (CAAX protease family)